MQEAEKRHENARFVAILASTVLVNTGVPGLVSFQQTVNLTTMMMLLGMGMAFMREESDS